MSIVHPLLIRFNIVVEFNSFYSILQLYVNHLELSHLVLYGLVGGHVGLVEQVVADLVRVVEVHVAALVNDQLAQAGAVHAPHKGDKEQDRLQGNVLQNCNQTRNK